MQKDDDSDAEGILCVSSRLESALIDSYRECFLYKWGQAVAEICEHLRDDVLLPLHPDLGDMDQT